MDYMTTEEFKKMVDDIVFAYAKRLDNGWDGSILDVLDTEIGGDKDFYKNRINPIDVIRELHYCNMNNEVLDNSYDDHPFGLRFDILMGICDCIEFCNRPSPKFKVGEILMNKYGARDSIVITEVDNEHYYFDHINNGDSDFLPIVEVHINFFKVGEATCDLKEFSKHKHD